MRDPDNGGQWLAINLEDECSELHQNHHPSSSTVVTIMDETWFAEALWSPLFGAVIVRATNSEGWLLPDDLRNLPRHALDLARVLGPWCEGPMERGPPSSDPNRLSRLQRSLDAIHASTDPVIRLALRINLARYEPAHLPLHLPRDEVGVGTPSHVAYDLSYRFLLTLSGHRG
jgi:hypothetical protein